VKVPAVPVCWHPCWRVIPARYAEEKVLEKLGAPGDLPILMELEQFTNERVRTQRGEIRGFAAGDEAKGPGKELIMAAFAYKNPEGSRFSDGSYGVCYVARALQTAVEETKHHRAEFMRRTNEGPMRLPMRALTAALDGHLHDIRGMEKSLPKVYSKTSYTESQALARNLRKDGSEGIVYDSVRHPGGECSAVFRPAALTRCRMDKAMMYEWDGKQIANVYELNPYENP